MSRNSLPAETLKGISERLARGNTEFTRHYPGESGRRQPVHTVYGGAHLFKADTAQKLGAAALSTLQQYASSPPALASLLDFPTNLADKIHSRITEKLRREPVEDFRVDFEDGYGNRPDAEEDGHAQSVAHEMAEGMRAGSLPPFIGIRIKPFSDELKGRSIRTLDIFLSTLLEKTGGKLPANFAVTLPKIIHPEQAAAMADLLEAFESTAKLPARSLVFEVMIETPQSIIGRDGSSNLPRFLEAARGRCIAAHFGVYDYTASCSITAAYQGLTHPACDFARHMMQVAFAGTGIWLSDGATNIMPVGDRAAVHRGWKLHYDQIRHSLMHGFYQGWDLHPAQLPTRYAAVYAFFLESLEQASERLRNFIDRAAKATLIGEVFDDAATGQGLLNYFLRAMNCGAISESDAQHLSGLSLGELRSASFVKIIRGRMK